MGEDGALSDKVVLPGEEMKESGSNFQRGATDVFIRKVSHAKKL